MTLKIVKADVFIGGVQAFTVYDGNTLIGYVWHVDGAWWANDQVFDESVERFSSKHDGAKWLRAQLERNGTS